MTMYELEPEEEAWRLLANCRGVDDLKMGSGDEWLIPICEASCPVRSYCARSAIKSRDRYIGDGAGSPYDWQVGVWGGVLLTHYDYSCITGKTKRGLKSRKETALKKWAKLEEIAKDRPLLIERRDVS